MKHHEMNMGIMKGEKLCYLQSLGSEIAAWQRDDSWNELGNLFWTWIADLDRKENKGPSDHYIILYILQKNHREAAATVLGVCKRTSGIAGFCFVLFLIWKGGYFVFKETLGKNEKMEKNI